MVATRLDVHFRADPSTDALRARFDPGGAGDTGYVDLTLTNARYSGLAALCSEIQTQLQTVDASFACSESAGIVTISASTTCEIVWSATPLMRWLGFSANLGSASSHTGTLSPGSLLLAVPWSSDGHLGWQWTIRRWSSHDQQGGSIKLARSRLWSARLHILRDELDQARGVLSYILKGYPARWWRNAAESSAWSYTTFDGYSDVLLAPGQTTYVDEWADELVLSHLVVPLDMVDA